MNNNYFLRQSMLKLLIGFMCIIWFCNSTLAEKDIRIWVTSITVTSTAGLGELPDVYIYIQITAPEDMSGKWAGEGTSIVLYDQDVGSHPHLFWGFTAPHYNPVKIYCTVYDYDYWPWYNPDDPLCEAYWEIQGLGNGTHVLPLKSGTHVDIGLTIHIRDTDCGGNVDYAVRSLPDTASVSEEIEYAIRLHKDSTSSPLSFNYYEQIPIGFEFLGAEPMPDSISLIEDDEGYLFTELFWEFLNPNWDDQYLMVYLFTPDNEDALYKAFCSQMVIDDTVIYSCESHNDVCFMDYLLSTPSLNDPGNSSVFLSQNHPNPFKSQTTIKFTITDESQTTLTIYDLQGKKVETLINERLLFGSYSCVFNASDLECGLYFYELKTEDQSIIKKMLVVR